MATKSKKENFDFKTIKTFEDACKKLGLDPSQLPDVTSIPEEFRKPIVAGFKLMIIYKAINDGWKPDWNNYQQWKYYPWYGVLSSGFGFSDSDYYCGRAHSGVGSRLCTDTRDKALYIAEQFKTEYQDYFL
jgi:hypothetical protein